MMKINAECRTQNAELRSGISLMEVLISIGIMAIGMVSIASLLPVGGRQVQRATTEERKAELGLNAFREFQIRGMGNPGTWLRDGSAAYAPVSNVAYMPAVVIDPFMIAVAQVENKLGNVMNFPAISSNSIAPPNPPVSGAPSIARLTLTSVYNSTAATSKALGEALFTMTNELVVDQDDDRTLPGTGHMMMDTSATPKPIKRDYEGNYSWLAMLSPKSGYLAPVPSSTAPYTPPAMDQYVLSIVIFERRRAVTPSPGSGQEEMTDTQVKVDNGSGATIPTQGTVNIGGGEMVLKDTTANAEVKFALAKPGNWMLLCRKDGGSKICKWYRIVSASEGSATGTLDVTLAGPDWVWGATTGTPEPTYACLFDGAVAVYERSIHLEDPSSIWNQ